MTQPRAGSIRYTDDSGTVHVAHPREIMYSTVTMLATEFWCEDKGCWLPIFDDLDEPALDAQP